MLNNRQIRYNSKQIQTRNALRRHLDLPLSVIISCGTDRLQNNRHVDLWDRQMLSYAKQTNDNAKNNTANLSNLS